MGWGGVGEGIKKKKTKKNLEEGAGGGAGGGERGKATDLMMREEQKGGEGAGGVKEGVARRGGRMVGFQADAKARVGTIKCEHRLDRRKGAWCPKACTRGTVGASEGANEGRQ